MRDAYVFDAIRTPRGKGKANGALAAIAPHELVRQVIDALRVRTGGAPDAVDRFDLSCVGQIGAQGGHLALVSRLHAGLPDTVTCLTINNFCVGGLTAVASAANAVRAGDAGLALAGGVECMSQVPFLADKASYYADPETARALNYVPVALSADFLAFREGITRADLDAVTLESHRRAAAAWSEGRYGDSVIPVRAADETIALDRDETIRAGMTAESLAALPPAFERDGKAGFDDVIRAAKPGVGEIEHRHSIANCPPVADGAALALVGTKDAGAARGLAPLARIRAQASINADAVDQLTAGFAAMELALDRAGMELGDVERIEFMEAFAAVPVKFARDYHPDPARVNVNGGHLALGHPMGATGAALLATLVHEMARSGAATGLVVAHGGSGVGSAMVIERV